MSSNTLQRHKNSSRGYEPFDFLYFRPLLSLMTTNDDKIDDNTDGRMLFNAIRKGKQHLVRFILEAAPGNVVDARDFNGKTPLMVVTSIKEEFRRASVARLLLYHGADINLPDDHGRTPLSYACEKRCNDLVEILVKQRNIDPDIADDKGNTPLMYCAMVGNDIALNTLVRHFRRLGLRIDHVNKEGSTPLVVAAKNGNITCSRILFHQGQASLLSRDKSCNLSVEELLQNRGFTLEDLLPLAKQLEAKKRFLKVIHFARFTKAGLTQMRFEPGKIHERSSLPRSSVGTSSDIYGKEISKMSRSQLRSVYPLPPVKNPVCNTKANHLTAKRSTKQAGSLCLPNKAAIVPPIWDQRRGTRDIHNVGLPANYSLNLDIRSDSAKSDATDIEAFSNDETSTDDALSDDTSQERI